MFKKNLFWLALLLAVFTVVGTISADDPSPIPELILTIEAEPWDGDADWPIVSIETTEYIDERGLTHVRTRIVRESPKTDASLNLSTCNSYDTHYEGSFVSTTCNQNGGKTVTDSDELKVGGITVLTMFGKSIFDKYYRSGDPHTAYYLPTKAQMWWTRANSTWTVQNASGSWGCSECGYCEGGTGSVIYPISSFTPGWSGNNSSVYSWIPGSPSLFVPMRPTVFEFPLGLVGNSGGYQYGSYKGSMSVQAVLGF